MLSRQAAIRLWTMLWWWEAALLRLGSRSVTAGSVLCPNLVLTGGLAGAVRPNVAGAKPIVPYFRHTNTPDFATLGAQPGSWESRGSDKGNANANTQARHHRHRRRC